MQFAEAIRLIKERINIVDLVRRYIELKPNGPRYVAPCPFHQETKPSFSVHPEKGFFYCFGCHASGDIFEFYSKMTGLDFKEALEELAAEAGISIDYQAGASSQGKSKDVSEKRQMLRMHETAARHFQACLAGSLGEECRKYLKKRGLSQEIIERFELGWAPDSWNSLADVLRKNGYNLETACRAGLLSPSNRGSPYDRFRGRLMFPIRNLSGQIIAFGGRIIKEADEAKYINSSDTLIYSKKEHLYGLYQARRSISTSGKIILTEGYMDVLALCQFGFNFGCGVLGTSLTEEQVRRISGFTSRVVLIFDGDRPGRKAALRASEMLLSWGLACSVVILPPEDDIDSLLRSQGPEKFTKLLDSGMDGLIYCINALRDMAPREAVEWSRNFLAHIKIPELASPYATTLANQLRISEDSLRSSASSFKSVRSQPASSGQEQRNMRDTQIIAFATRYPERLEDLRELGADLALCSERARQFWEVLEQWEPDEIFYHLDDRQKEFWLTQRGPDAPPRNNGDFELACLSRELASYYASSQKSSLYAAMLENSGSGDFGTELEYLRAITETLEKK